jgi:hypothetical protein
VDLIAGAGARISAPFDVIVRIAVTNDEAGMDSSTVSDTRQSNGVIVGKLDGKVAVITGGSTGMALAGAQLFVEEGAHVFIQARRQGPAIVSICPVG